MVGAESGKKKRDMDTAKVGSWHRAMKGGYRTRAEDKCKIQDRSSELIIGYLA